MFCLRVRKFLLLHNLANHAENLIFPWVPVYLFFLEIFTWSEDFKQPEIEFMFPSYFCPNIFISLLLFLYYGSTVVKKLQEVIVTRKYQITIPKSIREKLGIRIGDRLLMEVDGDKIVIRPINHREVLDGLATIADRILSGPRKIDAVKLVEESLGSSI